MIRRIGRRNMIWIVLLVVLAGSLFFGNLINAYSWVFIKLAQPIIGLFLFLVILLLLIFRKK